MFLNIRSSVKSTESALSGNEEIVSERPKVECDLLSPSGDATRKQWQDAEIWLDSIEKSVEAAERVIDDYRYYNSAEIDIILNEYVGYEYRRNNGAS